MNALTKIEPARKMAVMNGVSELTICAHDEHEHRVFKSCDYWVMASRDGWRLTFVHFSDALKAMARITDQLRWTFITDTYI